MWLAVTCFDSVQCVSRVQQCMHAVQQFPWPGGRFGSMHDNSQYTCGLQCSNLPGYSSCEQNAAMHACCAAIFHGLEVDSVQCMTTANTHVACGDLF